MKPIGREIRDILKKKNIPIYRVAKHLGVKWESLYRSLLDDANPEWKRIGGVLDYLNYDFILKPKRKEVKPVKPKPSKKGR